MKLIHFPWFGLYIATTKWIFGYELARSYVLNPSHHLWISIIPPFVIKIGVWKIK